MISGFSTHRSAAGILLALSLLALSAAANASAPVVIVNSPITSSTDSSPVHYVASATSSQCSKGIAAMRIYLAPHVSAFTVKSANLDRHLPLSPGNYQTIVQAWDNCGGIGKTAINITVSAKNLRLPRFLYATTNSGENQHIWGYVVNPQTGALTATKQGPFKGVIGAVDLASDQGGYRLYVRTRSFNTQTNLVNESVSGHFIDRRNGHLTPGPGPRGSLGLIGGGIAVHPSGKLVFAGTNDFGGAGNQGVLGFGVNSDGSLSLLSSTPLPAGGDPNALAVDRSGRYLYVAEADSSINAFNIDVISGALTPLPGSPFQLDTHGCTTTITSIADLFGRFLYASEGFSFLAISGFSISRTTGTLTEVPGSPFPDPSRNSCDSIHEISGLTTEPTGRFLYVGFIDNSFFPSHNTIQKFAIDAGNGVLLHVNNTAINYGGYNGGVLAVDPSGKYLYTSSDIGVIGFSINSATGDLTVLPGSPFSKLPSVMQDLVVTP